ncbi:MAG: hypothetical protein WBE92_12195 [Steroidobacteraceae bacterium]
MKKPQRWAKDIDNRVVDLRLRAGAELQGLVHIGRSVPTRTVLDRCDPGCPACAAEDRYGTELQVLGAQERSLREQLAQKTREAASRLDSVRRVPRPKVDATALAKALQGDDRQKALAAKFNVSERTIRTYSKKIRKR